MPWLGELTANEGKLIANSRAKPIAKRFIGATIMPLLLVGQEKHGIAPWFNRKNHECV
jgi:hypothetical protein